MVKFRDDGNLGYYQKISELATNPAALPLLPEKLADVARKIFRSNNVEIMFVGEEQGISTIYRVDGTIAQYLECRGIAK